MASGAIGSQYSRDIELRALVKETIRSGRNIDTRFSNSNTLLHLAVENDLQDCVVKLLSSGADATLRNDNGMTPRDLALDNGNQILLQILSRREEYTLHLQLFNKSSEMSFSSNMDHFQLLASIDESSTNSKMVPLKIGIIYEDYMDWTDSQRCMNLQVKKNNTKIIKQS